MARPFSSQLGCYLYTSTTITIKRNQIWFNNEKEKGQLKSNGEKSCNKMDHASNKIGLNKENGSDFYTNFKKCFKMDNLIDAGGYGFWTMLRL